MKLQLVRTVKKRTAVLLYFTVENAPAVGQVTLSAEGGWEDVVQLWGHDNGDEIVFQVRNCPRGGQIEIRLNGEELIWTGIFDY